MELKKSEVLLDTIRRLFRRGTDATIRRILLKSHPSEIAAVIRQLSDEDGIDLLGLIGDQQLEAKTFSELGGGFLNTYLHYKDDKARIAEVLQMLPEDEAAMLLADLDETVAKDIMSLMHKEAKKEVEEILDYEENTCGRIMAVNIYDFNQNLNAAETIASIQQSEGHESLFYIYVVDDYHNLMGVLSLRQLLQIDKQTTLKEVMTHDVIKLKTSQPQEEAARFIEEYNFVSLPVVDEENKLVGMVTVDDIIDFIRDEAQEEALQLAGVEKQAIDDFIFWRALGSRGIWYAFLLLSGILCSEAILLFFPKAPQEIALLCLVPLVLHLGGSITSQTITFVGQSVLNTSIERSRSWRALWGQNMVTFLAGLLVMAFLLVYTFWRFKHQQDIVGGIAFGLIGVIVFSLFIGMFLPIFFDKLKIDAMTASSRFIHFMMDVLNLFLFFSLFWVVRGYF